MLYNYVSPMPRCLECYFCETNFKYSVAGLVAAYGTNVIGLAWITNLLLCIG